MTAALVGFVCVAASGAILVTLHFLPTGLDPIRYAVSDYGWTSYGLGYRAMVVLQGVGAILVAVGLDRETDVKSLGWLYVYGVVRLLRRYGIELAGREVVVVGRSNIVGKPLALMLMQKRTTANEAGCDATVTVAHTRTPDLAGVCRRADVLIAAAGKAGLITPEMVRPGAAVVDVGTNPAPGGGLVGDVDPRVAAVAGALSPVPGGVGPMTITMLLANALTAAERLDG